MKFINCAEALPGRVNQRFQVSEYIYIRNVDTKGSVDPGCFRSYAGLNENWALDKFEWLDETPEQLFSIEDMASAYKEGQIYGFEKCGQGLSNATFKRFMISNFNIEMP